MQNRRLQIKEAEVMVAAVQYSHLHKVNVSMRLNMQKKPMRLILQRRLALLKTLRSTHPDCSTSYEATRKILQRKRLYSKRVYLLKPMYSSRKQFHY